MRFFDTDRWNEIWQTISRNRKRSIMTALGVFWGIFMLIVLLGAGMGLGRLFRAQLGGMSTNTVLLQSSRTSVPYKGMPTGRWWRMDNDDLEAVSKLEEVEYTSGVIWGNELHCSYKERKGDYQMMGYTPDYQKINPQKIIAGRYINEVDMVHKRKVCVIGTQVQKDLFPGEPDPTGKVIKVGGSYFTIIGVMRRESSAMSFSDVERTVVVPISLAQQMFGYGRTIHLLALAGYKDVPSKQVEKAAREAVFARHMISPDDEKAAWTMSAGEMFDLERAREDLSINVMTLYLQVLYNKELTQIAERQLELSTQQAVRSRELVAAGKQPESARYESEALQANDELNLTQARNDLRLALLNLSLALNRESAAGFDIVAPQFDSVALASLHMLGTADDVYAYATENRPHIKAERLRLESAENAVRIAKSALYPSLSLRGGYGTGIYSTQEAAFGTQFRKNSSEFVGVSMSVPIFNRRATHNSILSARIAMRKQQLAVTDAEQSLRKEIEQAWYNADAAYGKYRSADAALASARVAFAYEQQKADAGRSTVFDFNDAKTRMEKAESELVQAKYEFVFRSKILDFYRGRPLEL